MGFGTIIVQNEGGDVTNLPGAQDLVGNYGYLVSNATNVWNPEAKATQKQITLWNGAEDVTYFVDAKVTEDLSAGTAIEFTLNGNVITSVTLLNKAENAKAVAACDGSVIYFTDDKSKEYALEDATVIYIDGKEIEGKATGEIKLAGKDESGKDVANVFFKASTDGKKVAVLFVDVNNAVAVQEDVTPPETNKHEHSYTWTIETEGEHKDEHKGTCTSKTGTCNAETIYHAVPTKNDDKVDGCSECTKLGDLDTPAVT